ncbi:hypothetical protein [Singulisphaera sp. PoT]|uniref:hypothetical protein n=1 Tax=Singulisphaera sp. PoT TaxID=3411797 RepID=UPI003BF54BE7
MPTKEQVASVVAQVGHLTGARYDRHGEPYPAMPRPGDAAPPPHIDGITVGWDAWPELDRARRRTLLDRQVDWEGFTQAERRVVEERVLDGEDRNTWMASVAAGREPVGQVAGTERQGHAEDVQERIFRVWRDDAAQQILHDDGVRYDRMHDASASPRRKDMTRGPSDEPC